MNGVLVSAVVVLFMLGCVSSSPNVVSNTMVKDDDLSNPSDDAMIDSLPEPGDEDAMEQGGSMVKAVQYVPFTQAAYDQARAEGKNIFLEFYANWCPICIAQAPALENGLSQLKSDQLVAFRVNYKDSETDADETALAKKYNITYQHTHVVADSSENVLLKSNENWSAQDVVEKVGVFN